MPNPKRKHSKSRSRKRRATKKIRNVPLSKCPNCGSLKIPHFACNVCGYYKGVEVIKIESKK
jgi:large subunit ribosomal protein L32